MKKELLSLFAILVFLASCNTQKEEVVLGETQQEDKDYLTMLIEGNERFVSNKPERPDQSLNRIKELTEGQNPFAVVLTCSDSRCPPELIFDQGLGDLFVIRNAGNIIGNYELGSIEYAVEHLDVSLVVVLGHSNCGAIGAYIEHQHDTIPNHIQTIVDYIKNEEEEQELEPGSPDYYAQAIKANVLHGVRVLEESHPVMREFIEKNKVQVVAGIYDLESGKVNFIKDKHLKNN